MNAFQAVLVLLFAAGLIRTAFLIYKGALPRRSGLVWCAVWLAATVLVLDPASSVRIGRLFGIGRGADFVIYVSVVAGAFVAFGIYMRTRRLEKALTDLARHQALVEAKRGGDPSTRSEAG